MLKSKISILKHGIPSLIYHDHLQDIAQEICCY